MEERGCTVYLPLAMEKFEDEKEKIQEQLVGLWIYLLLCGVGLKEKDRKINHACILKDRARGVYMHDQNRGVNIVVH